MVDITKEEIWNSKYEGIPKWREKKTKRILLKEFIINHKFLTAGLFCLSACVISNVVLIYSFFKVLGSL